MGGHVDLAVNGDNLVALRWNLGHRFVLRQVDQFAATQHLQPIGVSGEGVGLSHDLNGVDAGLQHRRVDEIVTVLVGGVVEVARNAANVLLFCGHIGLAGHGKAVRVGDDERDRGVGLNLECRLIELDPAKALEQRVAVYPRVQTGVFNAHAGTGCLNYVLGRIVAADEHRHVSDGLCARPKEQEVARFQVLLAAERRRVVILLLLSALGVDGAARVLRRPRRLVVGPIDQTRTIQSRAPFDGPRRSLIIVVAVEDLLRGDVLLRRLPVPALAAPKIVAADDRPRVGRGQLAQCAQVALSGNAGDGDRTPRRKQVIGLRVGQCV